MKKLLSSLLLTSSLLFAEAVSIPTINKTPLIIDISGEHIDFYGYYGKYVILEYFGTRCPMCEMELEHIKSMQKNNPLLASFQIKIFLFKCSLSFSFGIIIIYFKPKQK